MSRITLRSLTVDNFKGCSHFTFAPEGASVTIAGENASGKTTLYDSLVWLLFGKDSHDRKDFEIKPLNSDGTVKDHAAITSVEAVLSCDDKETKLKRTYAEKWTTQRGRSDAVFSGHTSDYYLDDIPVKKNAFDAAVSSMVDEATFRMLTNVSYFPEVMKWQDRRAKLFEFAGIMTDEEIMATDDTFAPLAVALDGRKLDDFKKLLTSKRKGLDATKKDTPARIDEQTKTVQRLEGIDFDALKAQRSELQLKLDDLAAQKADMTSKSGTTELNARLASVGAEITKLDAENRAYRAEQEAARANPDVISQDIARMQRDITRLTAQIKRENAAVMDDNRKLDDLRSAWLSISREEFSGADTCPTCGQKLPKKRLDAAKKAWEEDKKRRMQQVVDEADGLKFVATNRQTALQQMQADVEDIRRILDARLNDLEALNAQQPVEDMPGYSEARQKLEEQKAMITELLRVAESQDSNSVIDVENRIRDIRQQMAQLDFTIAQEAMLVSAKERIEELQAAARKASENLEKLENMIFLIEDYNRYKCRFVEAGINAMFEHTTFRLFKEQINGGLEECCDVCYQGIPYSSLNNGARINVGIDIIRTISWKTGTLVPLFVDNAESVTDLWQTGGQQIRLQVDSGAKELTII